MKYCVNHTSIKHGGQGQKEAALYEPGGEIELTEAEAQLLGDNVSPVETAAGTGAADLTVDQLKADLAACGDDPAALKGMKKAELVERWNTTRDGLTALTQG